MNVITIDFDIIMSPCIEFYNDQVDTENPIKNLVEKFSFLKSLPIDCYIYQYLTDFILKCKKEQVVTYVISDHSEIIKIFQARQGEEIHVFNIDHHHDIGYEIDNWKEKIKKEDCGNWVKYAFDNNLIKSYTWYCDDNSLEPPPPAKRYLTNSKPLKKVNLENINEIDELIICSSYEWIPIEYHPLFWVWENIVETV